MHDGNTLKTWPLTSNKVSFEEVVAETHVEGVACRGIQTRKRGAHLQEESRKDKADIGLAVVVGTADERGNDGDG